MTNKDIMLLEEAYNQIVKEKWENINPSKYICVNTDNGEYYAFDSFEEAQQLCDQSNIDDNTNVWVVKHDGNVVYSQEEIKTKSVIPSHLKVWRKEDLDRINNAAMLKNKAIANRYRTNQNESFVHGIQPITEAKKKVNPWAIEKSIEKKTGKKFGKKHKEEIVKGIKKSAKKYGKKITSDKIKSKK
jgi:hypothetical protein